MYNKWVRLVIDIDEKNELICPECRVNNVEYQYVGDKESRVGYLVIWCNACNNGIRISRVKAPIGENMLSFTDDVSILNRVKLK